jgi:hypothetical protein
LNQKLRNPVPDENFEWCVPVINQGDHDFASVARINGAGGIQYAYTVLERKT